MRHLVANEVQVGPIPIDRSVGVLAVKPCQCIRGTAFGRQGPEWSRALRDQRAALTSSSSLPAKDAVCKTAKVGSTPTELSVRARPGGFLAGHF